MTRFKLLAVAMVAALAVLVFPVVATAAVDPFQEVCGAGGGGGTICSSRTTQNPLVGQDGVIVRVTSILAIVAGIVSVIFIVWAGIKYITSNGDSAKISSAKSTIIYALIGLVVAVLARPMINFVIGRL